MHERDNVAIVGQRRRPAGRHARCPAARRCATRCRRRTRWRSSTCRAGAAVMRYGVVIGYARPTSRPAAGCTSACCRCPRRAELDGLPIATVKPAPLPPLDGYTFEGYRNADGSVGTRNLLAITTTVQCVAGVVDVAVERIRGRAAAAVPERRRRGRPGAHLRLRRGDRRARRGDPDPHAAPHQPEPELRRRGDGGEPGLREAATRAPVAAGRRSPIGEPCVVRLQDDQHVGFMSMIDSIMAQRRAAPRTAERAAARDACPPASWSSACSAAAATPSRGVTANPAVGFCTDLLVRAGATVMFSEVTEVRDAHRPAHRRAPPRPRSPTR